MASSPGDGATLYNELRRPAGSSIIDVVAAEEQFNALARRLSRPADDDSSTNAADVEKGKEGVNEPFNLREYLTASNDANQAAGIKHKHVGVTWDDLEVTVMAGLDNKFYIGTFGGAILAFFLGPFLWLWSLITPLFSTKEFPTRTILHKQSGSLKPGEMCLVLGCPGSGCSTFLRTISNQREGYASVSGNVLYAGMSATEIAKYYQGEVVYNEEDDIHIATLTVAQTLAFALSTKTPGPNGRLPGVSRKEFDREVLETLLQMLNISHTKETLVGSAFVRGVSGGERKRVSIAEMMATRARVQAWDNSTRGLDAATALDFVKSLKVMTDVLGQTTFVSLYQAGESIYELFDKVLVLDQGRQVYFGPPSEARSYFENLGYKALPRQSTADYLTGCTDPNERQFAPGRSSADVPSTPEAMEKVFRSSATGRSMADSREKYKLLMETEKTDQEAFRAAVAADRKGSSKKSPYTLGFLAQVRALTIRLFQQRLQDKFQLYTSFSISTILALVIGAAFVNLPTTSAGGFTRGSVLFTAILNCSLDAFGEIPMQMLGRPILQRQTGYKMYRPAATSLANLVADLPFSASRWLIFDIIIYFMTNLNRSAGGFFVFHLLNYTTYLALQGFFRTFGLMCKDFNTAFRLSTFFVPPMVIYSGYMIPKDDMPRFLFWIYYINPVSFAWQGCMENEFSRISLTCDGTSVIPRNTGAITKYPTGVGLNQVCTLAGATNGSTAIPGRDYIFAGFGIHLSDLWRNFGILVAFFILFQITQMLALEYYPQYTGSLSISLFAKEDADAKKRNAILRERKLRRREERENKEKLDVISGKNHDKPSLDRETVRHRKAFTWENLNYHVPVPGGTLRLLHDVNGYVKPGTLTALMGASGAGKTTCLDVLAQRKTIGVISGDLLVDGRPLDSDFARGTAYAEQMDVHEGTATVREAMRFSAYLRQPAEISIEEKNDYVDEMIELLELQDLSEALVFTLNVEARKRLTIGVELASKPELLLFLDEPTSGLDAQSAWNLVRFLRKLADQGGQAILCTIHQPSSLLFESFDRLLLLERGGETVYFGDIGPDSQIIRDYFARYGAVCPANVNPAEHMLDAIGAGLAPRVGDRDWKDLWLESPEHQTVKREIAAIKAGGLARPVDTKKTSNTYATSFLYQLQVVSKRNNLALWRSPDYIFSRLFVCGLIALAVGLSFLQLGVGVKDLQYRVFALFWVTILPIITMGHIEPAFISNRMTFIREASSRIYSPYVFALAQLFGELGYNVLAAIVFWVLLFFPMHFGQGAAGLDGVGFQLLVIIFTMLFGVTLGQLVAALSPSVQVAVLFNPIIGLTLGTFCGVTLPYPTMISFWRDWLYQISPYTRALAAMISTELTGLVIRCKPDEFAIFDPPSTGQTCMDWAGDFVNATTGYLDNPDATSGCRYCVYSKGDEFFLPLNMRFENRWRDCFIMFSFFIFNVIATVIASRFLRYAKR
ncbi:ABC-2 type transporter-domain-containing protein [Mycena floridula]|nr:ABC-2 type transporter-domain-containing protein [Mycena floridula]